jgi:urocanate hydratase
LTLKRFKANLPSSNDLQWQAFPARNIHCASIMVQLCNNLSFEIAQYPEELVTYGGNGQCLANWAQFWLIMQMLSDTEMGETMVLNSSHPQGVYPSEIITDSRIPENALDHWKELMQGFAREEVQPVHSPSRPLLQISNGMCVPNYSTGAHYADFFALGVSNYGQMTAGSFCYIGPQGIVHGTTITLMSAAAQHKIKYGNPASNVGEGQLESQALKVKQVSYPFPSQHIIQTDRNEPENCQEKQPLVYLSSGLGGMSGAQAKAGIIASVTSVIVEVRPEPIVKRFNQKWVDEIITDLDVLIKRIRQLRKDKQVSSIGKD